MGIFNKKELKRISELEIMLEESKYMDLITIENKILASDKIYEEKMNQYLSLNEQIKDKQSELNLFLLQLDMIEFGFYEPQYNCMNSEEYANKIKINRDRQKEMVKSKLALDFSDSWTLDGNKAKGRAMNNDNMKMYLRAFNNECDVLIGKVKFNNIDKIEALIKKCAISLDKLNNRNKISVKQGYINLKIEELRLVHEHAVMKQNEKEANREAREQERENQKLLKEIESEKSKINKEKKHYEQAKIKLEKQLLESSVEEKKLINDKLNEVNATLAEIEINLTDIDYRASNSKAGYVYIISNIGSFGKDIYKIGMTRRLEPQDRIDELGDASVPFRFDVHAMIFSDDAPKLEHTLHETFSDNKVNMINGRKEFFNVSIDEIEKVIKSNHDKSIEFIKIPEADQYRESIKIKEKTLV